MAEKGERWVAREGKNESARQNQAKAQNRITPASLAQEEFILMVMTKLDPKARNAKHREKKKRAPKRREETYIIPICFTKFNCLVAPLNTRTVYKYIDFPSHKIQSTGKHGFDIFRVPEVAVHHLDFHVWAECLDGGNRIISQVGRRVWERAEKETEIGPGLGKCNGTCGAYACAEKKKLAVYGRCLVPSDVHVILEEIQSQCRIDITYPSKRR